MLGHIGGFTKNLLIKELTWSEKGYGHTFFSLRYSGKLKRFFTN